MNLRISGLLAVAAVTAVLAATPAWSQCTATDTQSLNAAIDGACTTITLGNNIQLVSDVAPIDGNLTINGGGFTIDGNNRFQALQVIGGTVAINNLTVSGALAQGSGGSGMGGGLFVGNGATVTTDNVALNYNEAAGGIAGAGSGGGIYNAGSLTLTDTTISGNTASGGEGSAGGTGGTGSGGGIDNAGSLTLTDTTISGNTASGGEGSAGGTGGTGSGGGIDNAGNLTLTDSTLTGNTATGGAGGAGGSGGSGYGGGIYVNQGNDAGINGTLTLSGNQAIGGTGTGGTGQSSGDGVLINGNIILSPPATVNQTVADSIAGGGGLTKEGTGTLTLSGTNTYTGGTQVDQGTLAVGNNSALGGGILTLAADTILQAATNGLTLGNLITLNGGATVDTKSNGLVLGNLISGNGGLTKVGTGTLNLIGANTYTGGTQVDQGVLIAQNNNVLGSGGVTVSSGAALDLNETSQTVGGLDLLGTIADTLGGTGAGDYGVLNTPGTVTINGSTLAVSACQICFALAVGDQFDIMTFDTLSGDFSAFSFDGNSCTWSPSSSGGIADCGDGPDFLLSEMPGSAPDDFYQLEVTGTATVPEPGTVPLVASAIFILFLIRRTPKA